MTDLLGCPFCGGRAERIDIDDGENAGGSCISCTVCQASSNIEFEFKENFVSNWNRRSDATLRTLEARASAAEEERDAAKAELHAIQVYATNDRNRAKAAEATLTALRQKVAGVLEPFANIANLHLGAPFDEEHVVHIEDVHGFITELFVRPFRRAATLLAELTVPPAGRVEHD